MTFEEFIANLDEPYIHEWFSISIISFYKSRHIEDVVKGFQVFKYKNVFAYTSNIYNHEIQAVLNYRLSELSLDEAKELYEFNVSINKFKKFQKMLVSMNSDFESKNE